jgi:outer membrane lipoprotein-sorting protein
MLVGGLGGLMLGQSGSSQIQSHVKALQGAPALTATLNVQPVGGAASQMKIAYSKPNLIKIETDAGWTLSDGATIYKFTKKDNAWTETPLSDVSMKQATSIQEAWAWRAFFDTDAMKGVVSSKIGANRMIKGAAVMEVAVNLENATATLFMDPKLGFARGFTFKSADTDLIITSTDIQLGKEPLPASNFAFSAPEGAKKQEAPAADAVTFSNVQSILSRNCMPCHSPGVRSGGHDLSSYSGVMGTVVSGSPEQSTLVRSISGPRPSMPKMRPPLQAAEVETISKWVAAGAKQD